MADAGPSRQVIRFGDFEFDPRARSLSRQGVRIRMREQLSVALSALLERPGEVVTREELQERLWPADVFVNFDTDLNTVIARLREALGDSAENPRFIETLPKRGYRFLAPASQCPATEPFPKQRTRLVVLPLANAGGDPAQEYFSDALTDEIITALCQAAPGHLAVIARTTAMHYKGSGKDIARIGRELGVDYAVEGAVHRGAGRLALNVQLIQTGDQTHFFAQEYSGGPSEIFRIVDQAATDIAAEIEAATRPKDEPRDPAAVTKARKTPTEDQAAADEYFQARYAMSKASAEGFALARQLLERAIARDTEFAPAHDALAEVDWYLGYYGYVPPRKAYADGIVHALRAIEIDNSRAETHALLGEFHKTLDYNWPEVHREMVLALRLDPASPQVRLRYAVNDLMPHGCLEEAIAELKNALESDSLSVLIQGWLGVMLVLDHQWDRAVEQGKLLLKLFPSEFWGHFILGVAYRETGRLKEAISSLRQALQASGMPGLFGWLGLTLGRSGNTAEARSLLAELQAKASRGHVPPTAFAWIYLGLGEMDAAFEWLDRAVEERDQFMMPIKSYSFFDPIRADPRFPALLRKMNLEP